jgi:hypothetical protein
MKSYKSYSSSRYVRKEDCPLIGTISEAREEEVAAPGKTAEKKPVLYFAEFEKGLVCNQANGDTLFELTGYDRPDQWRGVRVELVNDPRVTYGGKRVGGIRLRPAPAEENGEQPL